MKLNEMTRSRKQNAGKALREHYEVNLDFDKMNIDQTKRLLGRVRGLLGEAKTGKAYHARHENSGYLKLVMMEQALKAHYSELRVQHRLVMENEEVQKSQVLLAAQDMIDGVQKMIVDISKMKVEELPAVVTGVNNEIGAQEGATFEGEVQQALTALEGGLTTAKQALTQALAALTGGGDIGMDGGMGGEFGGEMGDEFGAGEMGDEMGGDMGGDIDAEDDIETSTIGRELR
jgi:hypothetical protein